MSPNLFISLWLLGIGLLYLMWLAVYCRPTKDLEKRQTEAEFIRWKKRFMADCTCPENGPGKVWGLHRKDCPARKKK